MILNNKDIKHSALRAFWASNGEDAAGLPADQIKRLKMILVHLHTARSLRDIAEGLGKLRKHHKLKGYECRYAMWVTGNYRITYDCEDPSSGVVTVIDYEDYH
jgi:plasmid maintenance system killer protein